MTFLRWLIYWPLAMLGGQLTTGGVAFVGSFLFCDWWLAGCLAIFTSLLLQPAAAFLLACWIAPKTSPIVAWSILMPYVLVAGISLLTIFALTVGDYEGNVTSEQWFTGMSAWEYSLAANLGLLFGNGLAITLWEDVQKPIDKKLLVQNKEEAVFQHHGGLIAQQQDHAIHSTN